MISRIRCVVERITYQNPENGYTVLKTRIKGYDDLVPVVGNLVDATVGSVLLCEGEWKVDRKYGRQFLAAKWEETVPATVYGIEKYLGSGLIKGVGPKFAKRIVNCFGTNTISIIEEEPNKLYQVSGIGKARVHMIQESWHKQKEVKNIMLFLQSNGVSTAYAAKIYKTYGNEAITKVKENPYQLADDIWGIGFKTADSIAEHLGFGKESFMRIRSGIMYVLSQLADEGHVYYQEGRLTDAAAKMLECRNELITMTMDQMVRDEDLIKVQLPDASNAGADANAIFLPPFYYAEKGIATKLLRIFHGDAPADAIGSHSAVNTNMICSDTGREYVVYTDGNGAAAVRDECSSNRNSIEGFAGANKEVDVKEIESRLGIEYDDTQAEAIRIAAASKVMVLTGGPGTGKTTTTQGIIQALRSRGMEILLAAPTGRAAKRMSEATGMEAKTIHRLLECKPPEGFARNENNPLTGDVLILDECSMIDTVLMNSLLKALPETMGLILIGDIDQLPSVGAGNVLRDIIDSGIFPVIRLTKIFRQAQQSRIIMNAYRINKGEFPDVSNGRDSDFFFISREEPEEAVKEIIGLVTEKLPKYYKIKPSDVQVLTPMQRGVIGAATLNMALQEKLNPNSDGLRRGGYMFRLYDKVMQIKNNYDKEVFNGDIGRIVQVNTEDRNLMVSFDGRPIEYDVTELDELVHAYATTIHKAQGSEYPVVVMPVMMNHYMMLQRNLIYTGITRAKKVLVMVGTKKALGIAVRNTKVTRRNTMLKERLCRNNLCQT